MIEAGCDVIIIHFGLTVGGSIGARESINFREAARLVEDVAQEIGKARSNALLLCHGGPIEGAENLKMLLDLVPIDGFVGASSIERVPIEAVVRASTASFSEMRSRENP